MLTEEMLKAAMLSSEQLTAISTAMNSSSAGAGTANANANTNTANNTNTTSTKPKISSLDVMLLPYMKLFFADTMERSPHVRPMIDSFIVEQDIYEKMLLLKANLESITKKDKDKEKKDGEEDANGNEKAGGGGKKEKSSKKRGSAKKTEDSDNPEEVKKKKQIEDYKKKIRNQEELLAKVSKSTNSLISKHYKHILNESDNGINPDLLYPPHTDKFRDMVKAEKDEFVQTYQAIKSVELRLIYIKEVAPIVNKCRGYIRDHIIKLPYLTQFQATDKDDKTGTSVIDALLCEQRIIAFVSALEAAYKKVNSSTPPSTSEALLRALKDHEEYLETVIESTSTIVHKHYRKKSVKIHPDRRGEEYRPIFEIFTKARNVFKEERLRQRYVKEMLQIVQSFGEGFVERSHKAWNEKHRPDEEKKGSGTDGPDMSGVRDANGKINILPPKEKKPLVLEGGLYHQIPKAPVIDHKNSNRTMTVWVNALKPTHEFYQRVSAITVLCTTSYKDEKSGEIKTIKKKMKIRRDEIVANHVRNERGYGIRIDDMIKVGKMDLPMPGIWYISWFAHLDKVSVDAQSPINATDAMVATPYSAETTHELVDPKLILQLENFASYEKSCIIVSAELENELQKMKAGGGSGISSSDMTRRYNKLHELVVRASKKTRLLKGAVEATDKASKVLAKIEKVLDSSRQTMVDFRKTYERATKKDGLRAFKNHIARVLESDESLEWMSNVTKEDLKELGGDSNRLYQLFIEGKGKVQLMVDSDMLQYASFRNDLFSTKQCNGLADRMDETIKFERREEEKIQKEEEERQRKEEEEKKRAKQAELGQKWAMIGTVVQVYGLESSVGKKLNGRIARVVDYLTDKDRFEVQCFNDYGEQSQSVSLKPENMASYFGEIPHLSAREEMDAHEEQEEDSEDDEESVVSVTPEEFSPSPSPSLENEVDEYDPSKHQSTASIESSEGTQQMTQETFLAPSQEITSPSFSDNYNPKEDIVSDGIIDNEGRELLQFLIEHSACIKGEVEVFFQWLTDSEDITSMDDMKEAVSDEEYLQDLQNGDGSSAGIKGFKRKAFKKAVLNFTPASNPVQEDPAPSTNIENPYPQQPSTILAPDLNIGTNTFIQESYTPTETEEEGPSELYCPISHILMINDPVIAADSVTYERASIEAWFQKKESDIRQAYDRLRANPHLVQERTIIENGITSPVYNLTLPNLTLTPNMSIRNMARDFNEMRNAERGLHNHQPFPPGF